MAKLYLLPYPVVADKELEKDSIRLISFYKGVISVEAGSLIPIECKSRFLTLFTVRLPVLEIRMITTYTAKSLFRNRAAEVTRHLMEAGVEFRILSRILFGAVDKMLSEVKPLLCIGYCVDILPLFIEYIDKVSESFSVDLKSRFENLI